MRDPFRIKTTLRYLGIFWDETPDLRLGQLILNAVPAEELYYIEDNELVARLRMCYYKTCGCGYELECVIHCNHQPGLCPGKAYPRDAENGGRDAQGEIQGQWSKPI
jgi:hypothetical protein